MMNSARSAHQVSFFRIILITLLGLLGTAHAQDPTFCTIPGTTTQGVQSEATDPYTGKPTCLAINRQPALYTGAFGDCLGSSEMEITRFSAAYYKDNLTLNFDLEGGTKLDNVNTIIYISVFAYGKNHFEYIWNPCGSAAQTICPTNSTRPFTSSLQIPLSTSDVSGIPDIAFQIPDFEGQAIMRIFSNNTQQEIACYSAVVNNGLTFAQPAAVGTVVGLFVLVALGASIATAISGASIVVNRLHYAHSMSMWVVFAVLQHVFLTGALSVNWPSVLPAWWSNFAWAAGMIYSPSMQNSIDMFVGNDHGNTTFVGAASTGSSSDDTGGGYSKSQILSQADSQQAQRRAAVGPFRQPALMDHALRSVEQYQKRANLTLAKRDSGNDTFGWYGGPVTQGLPLPGNYSGFAGTLSLEDVPASNAFMTGFLWLIVIIVVLCAAAVALKWTLEVLATLNWIRRDRFPLLRRHWLRFIGQVALRTCFIAFFLIMFLTMFQFSYHGASGPIGIAAIVFILFFVGAIVIAGWACWYRLRYGRFVTNGDRLHLELSKSFPPVVLALESRRTEKTVWTKLLISVPWIKIEYSNEDPRRTDIHQDEDYIRKFGWLTARFRSGSWWFFVFWLGYDFIRAIFLGGAAGHPQTQVFALLVIEFFAFCVLIYTKPFEANRLNALMIYLLGLSKILTTALSSAFDPVFNLSRIVTAALGIIIIVIQALLLTAMIILIVIGAVSTYISLLRDRELFYPEHWRPAQRAYLRHLNGQDKPRGTAQVVEELAVLEREPKEIEKGFRVDSIRRMPKIGDEDVESQIGDPYGSHLSLSGNASPIASVPPLPGTHTRRTSRALSTTSGHGNLPFGARPVRSESWSTHDFQTWNGAADSSHDSMPRMPAAIATAFHSRESLHTPTMERDGYKVMPTRGRASTLRNTMAATDSSASRPGTSNGLRSGGVPSDASQLEIPKKRKNTSNSPVPKSDALQPTSTASFEQQKIPKEHVLKTTTAANDLEAQNETRSLIAPAGLESAGETPFASARGSMHSTDRPYTPAKAAVSVSEVEIETTSD